jgi:hypothetical protein
MKRLIIYFMNVALLELCGSSFMLLLGFLGLIVFLTCSDLGCGALEKKKKQLVLLGRLLLAGRYGFA